MTFLPLTLKSFPGRCCCQNPQLLSCRRPPGCLLAWGTHGDPRPGQKQTGGCPRVRGDPRLGCLSDPAPCGLPEWPCIVRALGYRSGHRPCTLPRVFPPRRTFSLFSQFFGHWPHIHPLNFFYVSAPQRIMEQGQACLAGQSSPFSPPPSTCTPLTNSQWARLRAFPFYFQEKHSINCDSGTKVPEFSSNSTSHCLLWPQQVRNLSFPWFHPL